MRTTPTREEEIMTVVVGRPKARPKVVVVRATVRAKRVADDIIIILLLLLLLCRVQ